MTQNINRFSLRGLYAITDSRLIPKDKLSSRVEQAIIGGASVVQYRDKTDEAKRRFEEALALKQLCQAYNRVFIINDDVSLAQKVGADGVHIGQDDATLDRARAVLGEEAIIGVSCYNQFALAQAAVEAGANYVAFGRFFSSQIKPNAVQANLELLYKAREQLDCPVVAIGGITPENGGELVAAGAQSLAVIHGLFGQTDVRAAAERYAQLF
jgi:thiamine-phosphate pyrophosphorylase